MTGGFTAVYIRELRILRRRIKRQLAGMAVSPLLYLIAFGYAMGDSAAFEGRSYLEFLVPGLVAMSSMTQSFAIATDINVARFYWHIFEEFQAAPISNFAYVAAEVSYGMTRALISTFVILLIGMGFGVKIHCGLLFWAAIMLNSMVFASLAVGLAMLVRSHSDQAMLTNFVITPMAFLGGTFFPVERLPEWAQKILFFLPLSHAAGAIRAVSLSRAPSGFSYAVLALMGVVFFTFALYCVNLAKD